MCKIVSHFKLALLMMMVSMKHRQAAQYPTNTKQEKVVLTASIELSQVHPDRFVPAHFWLRNHLWPRHPHRDGAYSPEPGHVSAAQRPV